MYVTTVDDSCPPSFFLMNGFDPVTQWDTGIDLHVERKLWNVKMTIDIFYDGTKVLDWATALITTKSVIYDTS